MSQMRTPSALSRLLLTNMEQVDASIARYLDAMERADREDSDVAEAKTGRLKEKIEGLKQFLKEMEKQVEAAPDNQVSLTGPDARSMATNGKGTGIVAYNVQIAVDAERHLIVAHEVTNVGHDRAQLAPMGKKAWKQPDMRNSLSLLTAAIMTARKCCL